MVLAHVASMAWSLGFASVATAQAVWNVDCAGSPGSHFTTLQAAVDAAAPGDEIRVYGTANCVVSTTIITKALRIVGCDPAYVNPPGYPGGNPTRMELDGSLIIMGIPEGQRLIISNVWLSRPSPSYSSQSFGVVALDCDGEIVMEDCQVFGNGAWECYIHFERCQRVWVSNTDFYLNGSPIRAIDSRLYMANCYVQYFAPFPGPFGPRYSQTTESLRLTNSTGVLIATVMSGPPVYNFSPSQSYYARVAAVVEDSLLLLGPWTSLRGGAVQGFPANLPAYQLIGNSTVRRDPRTFVDWMPTPPPTVQSLPAMYHAPVVANELYYTTVVGPPGGFAVIAAGDYALSPLLTPFGNLVIEPSSLVVTEIVPLSAPNGTYTYSAYCPAAAPSAHAFAFQAATLSPSGEIALTLPSPFTVGWLKGRQP